MIFANWQEFFENKRIGFENSDDSYFDIDLKDFAELLRQYIVDTVVAKETITYFGDIVGNKQYELGEKE
jgi:adenylate cyclase class IV